MNITKSPLKAIRAKCLDCSGGHPKEVLHCPSAECPLYPFRFGNNPNRKGIGPGRIFFRQKTNAESPEIQGNSAKQSLFRGIPVQLEFGW